MYREGTFIFLVTVMKWGLETVNRNHCGKGKTEGSKQEPSGVLPAFTPACPPSPLSQVSYPRCLSRPTPYPVYPMVSHI